MNNRVTGLSLINDALAAIREKHSGDSVKSTDISPAHTPYTVYGLCLN